MTVMIGATGHSVDSGKRTEMAQVVVLFESNEYDADSLAQVVKESLVSPYADVSLEGTAYTITAIKDEDV